MSEGVDINSQSTEGTTALHVAASFNEVDALRFLLDHGAHVNLANDVGQTPLMYAAVATHLSKRADYGLAPNPLCTRAFAHGTRNRSHQLSAAAALLLGAGADMWAEDTNGDTALSIAMSNYPEGEESRMEIAMLLMMWEQKMPHAWGPDRTKPHPHAPHAQASDTTETNSARKKTTEQQKQLLRVGSAVCATGLQGAPELNGRVGVVEAVDDATGRYVVRFRGEKRLKKLLPKNLDVATAGATTD